MRFIFQLLLGMIIFNAMLIIFSPYFGNSSYMTGVDITGSSTYTSYADINPLSMLSSFFVTFLASFFITLLAARFLTSGNLPISQLLGASLVVSVFIGLWGGLLSPFGNFVSNHSSLAAFYTLFTIVLGIVVMISIVEIFTGKGDEIA